MTPEEGDALLAELTAATAQLAAAERLTDAIRGRRDRLVLALADAKRPHADIASAADITVQGVSKITRAAGLTRYRQRDPVP
jgi:hypothetical protein